MTLITLKCPFCGSEDVGKMEPAAMANRDTYVVVLEKVSVKISSSRSDQPQVHLVRKPSGIARRIRKNQLGTGRFAVSLMKVAQPDKERARVLSVIF